MIKVMLGHFDILAAIFILALLIVVSIGDRIKKEDDERKGKL